jgi:hypothetical protein
VLPVLLILGGTILAVRDRMRPAVSQPAVAAGPNPPAEAVQPVEDGLPPSVPGARARPPADSDDFPADPPPSSPGAAVAGAGVGLGIGLAAAELLDANAPVTAVAGGAGAVAGGAVGLLGVAVAAPVVIAAAAVVITAREIQDLFELSTGRDKLLADYRNMLDKASNRDEARRLAHEENARRYIKAMAEPKLPPWETDGEQLSYYVDRGRILGDVADSYGRLNFEGFVYDFKTGSTSPVATPPEPRTAPVPAVTLARVAAKKPLAGDLS